MILEAQEILAQLFFIELIGRRTVECPQLPHGPQIGLLSASAEPAKLQIAVIRSRKLGCDAVFTTHDWDSPVRYMMTVMVWQARFRGTTIGG